MSIEEAIQQLKHREKRINQLLPLQSPHVKELLNAELFYVVEMIRHYEKHGFPVLCQDKLN